jgi:hypothetical protein
MRTDGSSALERWTRDLRPVTDTMLVELRPWPGGDGAAQGTGGEDAGEDLVIHVAPDGRPWAWEIEHASRHADLVARALRAMRAERGLPDAA